MHREEETSSNQSVNLEEEFAKIDDFQVSEKVKTKIKSMLTAELTKNNESVEIGGKKFFILRVKTNNKDILAGPEGFNDLPYVHGKIVGKVVKDAGKKLFASTDDARAFLKIHIEGKNDRERAQNFADMLGLEKAGCHVSGGDWHRVNELGYWRIAEPGRYTTGSLVHGGKYHGEIRRGNLVISNASEGVQDDMKDIYYPVICFEDTK